MRQKVTEANERIRKAEIDRETAESAVLAVSFCILFYDKHPYSSTS